MSHALSPQLARSLRDEATPLLESVAQALRDDPAPTACRQSASDLRQVEDAANFVGSSELEGLCASIARALDTLSQAPSNQRVLDGVRDALRVTHECLDELASLGVCRNVEDVRRRLEVAEAFPPQVAASVSAPELIDEPAPLADTADGEASLPLAPGAAGLEATSAESLSEPFPPGDVAVPLDAAGAADSFSPSPPADHASPLVDTQPVDQASLPIDVGPTEQASPTGDLDPGEHPPTDLHAVDQASVLLDTGSVQEPSPPAHHQPAAETFSLTDLEPPVQESTTLSSDDSDGQNITDHDTAAAGTQPSLVSLADSMGAMPAGVTPAESPVLEPDNAAPSLDPTEVAQTLAAVRQALERIATSASDEPAGPASLGTDATQDPFAAALNELASDTPPDTAQPPADVPTVDIQTQGSDPDLTAEVSNQSRDFTRPQPADASVATSPSPEMDEGAGQLDQAQPDLAAGEGVPAPVFLDPSQPQTLAPEDLSALLASSAEDTWGTSPLMLPPEKAELLTFMVGDLKEGASAIEPLVAEAADLNARADAAAGIRALAESMAKTSEFFHFRSLSQLVEMLALTGSRLADISELVRDELLLRIKAISSLIYQHAAGLEIGMETTWPLATLRRRIERLLDGRPLNPALCAYHRGDVERVLELDRVTEGVDPIPDVPEDPPGGEATFAPAPPSRANTADPGAAAGQASPTAAGGSAAQTIRVELGVVDSMLEMIGELVQCRSRIAGLLQSATTPESFNHRRAELGDAVDAMHRLTSGLQNAVMRTRLQPLAKLFDRYPKIIADIANLADKQIELRVAGASTQVDKHLFDGLADPLTTILRYCASRDIETPQDRQAAGKPALGTIKLSAENLGSRVYVTVESDGRGLDPTEVAARAVTAAVLSEEQVDQMSEHQVLALLLSGSIADSPLASLAGQLERLGGEADLRAAPGKMVKFTLSLPVRSAIIPAILVSIGKSVYAVPLQAVEEVVKLDATPVHSVGSSPCLRLRERVIPVVDMHNRLGETRLDGEAGVAIVVVSGESRAALSVDRVFTNREIVVKQVDADVGQGPFSGVTMNDDGRVSLIVDVDRLLANMA